MYRKYLHMKGKQIVYNDFRILKYLNIWHIILVSGEDTTRSTGRKSSRKKKVVKKPKKKMEEDNDKLTVRSMTCSHIYMYMFVVCWGLTSLLNICGHIATVPTCSSGTSTNVLLHRNAKPQTQDMTPHPVTVYRHRTWHPTLSQYTDTEHDTPPCHSIQTQDMTPRPVTVYRHRTWHPTLSQYTDTGHDTLPCHSIQTQDMTPHPVTVYRHRTWHPTLSQYTDLQYTPANAQLYDAVIVVVNHAVKYTSHNLSDK